MLSPQNGVSTSFVSEALFMIQIPQSVREEQLRKGRRGTIDDDQFSPIVSIWQNDHNSRATT